MKPSLSRFFSLRAACAAALLGLGTLSAFAQPDPYYANPPGAALPSPPVQPLPSGGYNNIDAALPDRKAEEFITKVSMLQSEEARLSVIAAQRARHQRVRDLAAQVRSANLARDQELAQLAQRRSVLLPTGKDPRDAAEESEEWRSKDAKDFDADYVRRIIKIQQRSIDALEDCAKAHNSDPELAAFAEKYLPEFRENLRQAESMQKLAD